MSAVLNSNWIDLYEHFNKNEDLNKSIMKVMVREDFTFKDFMLAGSTSVKPEWNIEYNNIGLTPVHRLIHQHKSPQNTEYTVSGIRTSGIELLPNNTIAMFFTNVDFSLVHELEKKLDKTENIVKHSDGNGKFRYALTQSGMYEVGIYQTSP